MTTYNGLSNFKSAKERSKNLLSKQYPTNVASLIVDRKISKLPLSSRFITIGNSKSLNDDSIFSEIDNTKVNGKGLIRNLAFVIFLLLNLLFSCFINHAKKQKLNQKICFIYSLTREQIMRNHTTEALEKFLKEPRFGKLCYGSRLIVESKNLFNFFGINKHGDLEIVFDTSLWIARNMLNRRTVLRIILESMCVLAKILFQRKNNEYFVLRELIIDQRIWKYFLQKSVTIDLITTQSHFLRLPYSFYSPERNTITKSMIWYSTNSTPIENRKTHTIFDPEHFRLENIDTHFVWTEHHKQYLLWFNPDATVVVVGSILFQPKPKIGDIGQNARGSTIVFDVIPFEGLGVDVFYSREILTDFIDDIIEVIARYASQQNSEILLKPKREYSRKSYGGISPSRMYMDFIQNLHRDKKMRVLKADTDLYTIIGGASLVIGIPYTSPVTLAKEMNIPCIYYVPDAGKEWIFSKSHDDVPVIQGKKELIEFARKLR